MKNIRLRLVQGVVLLLGAQLIAWPAQAASFDCDKASTKVEKLVCNNSELSKLDEMLNLHYKAALRNTAESNKIRQEQRYWLKQRNNCLDVICIKNLYRKRLQVLSQSAVIKYEKNKIKQTSTQIRHSYDIVMSKNKKLCNYMVSLYNADMKTYGEIKYSVHSIFSRIGWEDINSLGPDPFVVPQKAIFDINNDGKKELVIKTNSPVFKAFVDELFIFPITSNVISKLKPGSRGKRALFDTKNILFRNYKIYYLNQASENDLVGNEKNHKSKQDITASIGPSFVLNPFILDGETFISMTDLDSEWFVIGKYKKQGEMQDICYFRIRR